MASASVSTETHAPFSIKLSADAAWREPSLVIRRTRTFVSTARMTLSDVTPDALSQLFEASGHRRQGPEHRPISHLCSPRLCVSAVHNPVSLSRKSTPRKSSPCLNSPRECYSSGLLRAEISDRRVRILDVGCGIH